MFNEKKTEYSLKSRQEVPVIQSTKYIASRDKALKAINDPTVKQMNLKSAMKKIRSLSQQRQKLPRRL